MDEIGKLERYLTPCIIINFYLFFLYATNTITTEISHKNIQNREKYNIICIGMCKYNIEYSKIDSENLYFLIPL